jgi:membrane associated rhomboid family serine protease
VLFIFIQFAEIPALVVLGFWFLTQVISSMADPISATGGVAWFAHIGGFIAGIVFLSIFQRR